jgi:hypothetical protein
VGHPQHYRRAGRAAKDFSRSADKDQQGANCVRLAATGALRSVAGHVTAKDRLQLTGNRITVEHQVIG